MAAVFYWGLDQYSVWVGLLAAVVTAGVWGKLAAPASDKRLQGSALLIFKLAFYALCSLLLYVSGQTNLAIAFFILSAVNQVMAATWGEEATAHIHQDAKAKDDHRS